MWKNHPVACLREKERRGERAAGMEQKDDILLVSVCAFFKICRCGAGLVFCVVEAAACSLTSKLDATRPQH